MIFTRAHGNRPTSLRADLCVVGSGAGGATVAALCAERGAKVVVVEAGPFVTPREMTQREDEMLPTLFAERATLADEEARVRILRGRCVGGSTVHNINLCKRAPAETLSRWSRLTGLPDLAAGAMRPLYEAAERAMSVSPMADEDVNANNRVLRRGAERLGWKGGLLAHNRRGCLKSGFCMLGCSFDAKENALKVWIPRAVRAGATVVADAPALALEMDGERVRRLRARDLVVEARTFCVSAGGIGTPELLRRSALPDPHGVAGRNLRLHPGAAVAAVMPERIEGWQGIPQSYEVTEFHERGVWIVPAFAHPAMAAALLPGFGDEHETRMAAYAHLAVVAPMIEDEGSGEVEPDGDGVRVRYAPAPGDRERLALGVRASAQLLFAAGAREVWLPFHVPRVARAAGDVASLAARDFSDRALSLTAVHPMGTARMGADSRSSVVDGSGRHHHAPNLFVADASLFPDAPGVPPQLTIYALAHRVAAAILAS